MSLLLSSILLILNLASTIKASDQKIVGGFSAHSGQFPHQVSIRWSKTGEHFCGGSIIGNTWILTAAHCIYNKYIEDIAVGVGSIYLSTGSITYYSSKLISHPHYHPFMEINDIGLIKINGFIHYSDNVKPIAISSNKTIPKDTAFFASGWGYQNYSTAVISNTLKYVVFKSILLRQCQKIYKNYKIHKYQLCVSSNFNSGICEGDVGGPLIHNNTLYGISSSIYLCGTGLPDVFTKVSSYRNWIRKISNI